MQKAIRPGPPKSLKSPPPPPLVPLKISRKTSYQVQIPQIKTSVPSSSRASYLALKIFH